MSESWMFIWAFSFHDLRQCRRGDSEVLTSLRMELISPGFPHTVELSPVNLRRTRGMCGVYLE
jgi:hypothetical protein